MKFLFSRTSTANFLRQVEQRGLWKGFHIRVSGTNNTGQTMAVGDIGDIRVIVNGDQVVFIPSDLLAEINNSWYGYAEATSAAGAEFAFGLFVPFEIPGFPNSLYIDPGDHVQVGINVSSAVSTKVANWTIDVNGVAGSVPESYVPNFNPADRSAINGTDKNKLPYENIFRVWVGTSNITRVQLEVDGELRHEGSWDSLLSETSLRNRVEGSLLSYVELETGETFNDMLTDDVQLQVQTSTSTNVKIEVLSIDFNRLRRERSLTFRRQTISKRHTLISQRRGSEIVDLASNPLATQKAIVIE